MLSCWACNHALPFQDLTTAGWEPTTPLGVTLWSATTGPVCTRGSRSAAPTLKWCRLRWIPNLQQSGGTVAPPAHFSHPLNDSACSGSSRWALARASTWRTICGWPVTCSTGCVKILELWPPWTPNQWRATGTAPAATQTSAPGRWGERAAWSEFTLSTSVFGKMFVCLEVLTCFGDIRVTFPVSVEGHTRGGVGWGHHALIRLLILLKEFPIKTDCQLLYMATILMLKEQKPKNLTANSF